MSQPHYISEVYEFDLMSGVDDNAMASKRYAYVQTYPVVRILPAQDP